MRKIITLLILVSLAGCASHRPAPEPSGSYFPINEKPLVPQYQERIGATNVVEA